MRKPIVIALIAAGALIVGAAAYGVISGREHKPDSAAAWEAKGTKEYFENSFDAAVISHTRAIELEPQNPLHYVRRALALRDQGKYEAAAEDFTRAIERDTTGPGFQSLYYAMRGRALGHAGRMNEALADFDHAISLDTSSADAYRERGRARISLGDFVNAKADFEAAQKIEPDPMTNLGLGITYYWERDWAKASELFAAARKEKKGDADIAMWSILAHLRNKQTVNVEDYQDIDHNKWPGQAVAFLFGQKDIIDNLIEVAAARNSPQVPEFICTASFVSLSLIQIEDRVEQVNEEYAKTGQSLPFLDDTYKTFEKCPTGIIESVIGRKEIEFLKAQTP